MEVRQPRAPTATGAGPADGGGSTADGDGGCRRLLTGWGRTAPTAATVVAPADAAEVARLGGGNGTGGGRAGRGPAAVLARGAGRSYGDAAQCAGGLVLDLAGLAAVGPVDPTGRVQVGGGARLADVLARVVPEGWFVPVTPGTAQVTVGGAVAADVHGKNHHVDGSLGRHVPSLTLVAPAGTFEVGPDEDAALFWATVGGMGLTGVVVAATVQLVPVPSAWMVVDTVRLDDLDAVMAELEAGDAGSRYSVAWIDCARHGGGLGRGIVSRGDHAPADALPAGRRADPFRLPGRPAARVPAALPWRLVTGATVRAFNEMWFRRAPRRRLGEIQPYPAFFHPLDALADWNRLYGRRGFVQYQFVVGADRHETVRRAVAAIADAGPPAVLAVLKRFGPGDPGPLSFPMAGWTLAVDFPVGDGRLPGLLDRLDDEVAGAGGRVYLAKDARLRPELLPVMYPRVGELAAVRRRVDPGGILTSDLARRLRLPGGQAR